MVLNIFAVLFVLAITFFHSIFGLFSGLINVVCTILSVCVALGFWEPMTNWLTKDFELNPGYTAPVVLVLLFALTLIILRSAADNLIRGNVRVPMYVDWGGGAVCGFINAQCAVGILVIGFLMLPFGSPVMMFSRYARTEEKENNRAVFERRSVWLNPDGFVVGLFNLLSNGSAKGTTTLASVYPSFTDWVSWTGNTVQSESLTSPLRDKKNGDGYQGLQVVTWWEQKTGAEGRYRKNTPTRLEPDPHYEKQTLSPAPGMKLIGVQLTLPLTAADRTERGDTNHRFRPTQIRLVGDEDRGSSQYFPRIVSGADPNITGAPRIVDVDTNFSVEPPESGETPLDLYFEVEESFKPRFIEYRRYARAAMTPEPASKTTAARELKLLTPEQRQRLQQLGQMGFIGTTIQPGTGDYEFLPWAMAPAALRDSEATISGETLTSGRFAGPRDRLSAQQNAPKVDKFRIPEGMRLMQVRTRPRMAETLAGQVFNFVSGTVSQFSAVDSEGRRHRLVGYYGVVRRNGQEYIELFFAGSEEAGYNGMLDFKDVKRSELTASDDHELGLLFFVPPRTTITRVVNQGNQGVEISLAAGG